MRLRYAGSASTWGFAIYRASHDDYILPSGHPTGTPQEALDCACGLYLGDTTAWLDPPPPTNYVTGATTSEATTSAPDREELSIPVDEEFQATAASSSPVAVGDVVLASGA